jgi:heat-inducible transcriptional repressor
VAFKYPPEKKFSVVQDIVVQVGRSAAAVLAVTTAGYVRTRVARVRTGLSRENAAALAALLNRNLTFVAPVDLSTRMLSELCGQIAPELVPVVSAAAAILQDSVKPHVFLGGEQYLLDWPQLDGRVGDILTLLNDEEQAADLIAPPENRSESVLLGEDLEPQIPGLCIVSDRYLVGGGLWGSIALIGPTRMPFQKLMPLLHEFADQLGEGMSGKRKDTPQAAVPRRTVIYKEDLE